MQKIVTFLLLFISLDTMGQQVSMREVFKQMPDSIFVYLTENNRLDFIDFIDSHMNAEVTNALGGKSRMLQLTDRFLSVRLNEASAVSMKLLPVSEPVDSASHIICMVRTFGKDIQESIVSFYSLKWKPLNAADYIQWPTNQMYVATLTDEADILTLESVGKLDAPANEEQKEYPKTSITFNWNGVFVNNN